MRQILLLILFVLVGRWLVKSLRMAQAGGPGRSEAARGPHAAHGREAPRSLAEPMVRCAACGVHAPKGDSIAVGQQYFCCAEHARPYATNTAGSR